MPFDEKAARAARAHLKVLHDTLDGRSRICECCGLTVYEDRSEQHAKVQVEAMLTKLDRWLSGGINGKEKKK